MLWVIWKLHNNGDFFKYQNYFNINCGCKSDIDMNMNMNDIEYAKSTIYNNGFHLLSCYQGYQQLCSNPKDLEFHQMCLISVGVKLSQVAREVWS